MGPRKRVLYQLFICEKAKQPYIDNVGSNNCAYLNVQCSGVNGIVAIAWQYGPVQKSDDLFTVFFSKPQATVQQAPRNFVY